MSERYLSYTEVAELIGVKTGALGNYNLPDLDAFIGRTRGCKHENIETWSASRPSHGGRPAMQSD